MGIGKIGQRKKATGKLGIKNATYEKGNSAEKRQPEIWATENGHREIWKVL